MTVRDISFGVASRVSAALAAAVLTLVVTSAAAQDTTGVGAISGVVVDAAGRPAEGVRVCALDTATCATSDARGVFRIGELRAGGYRLEILPREGLPFTSDEVDVRAGLDGTVEITLPTAEDFQQTVTVTAPAFQAPDAVKSSSFLVDPREILKSAAALQDVSRYVQGLPGVVIGTNDFRNDIIVRGGSPLENLFLVDNVEIPNINAFANFASAGGTVSLLDAELLQDVTFLTGGYPAPYINRTSSVLQMTQREGNRKKFGGLGHGRLCRRRRHSRRADQLRKGIVGGVGAAELPGSVHRGRRDWRRAGALFVQCQGRVRPHAAGPHLDGQHRGRRRGSARPHGIDGPRRGDCQLRHPLRRLAQRHGLQLAAHVRVARRGPVRRHATPKPRWASR